MSYNGATVHSGFKGAIMSNLLEQAVPPQQSDTTTIPLGLCQCGCGQRTTLAPQGNARRQNIKGQPQRYIKYHRPLFTFDSLPATRICRMCAEEKPIEQFGFVKNGKPILYSYCRPCSVEKQRQLPLEYRLVQHAARRAKKKHVPFSLKRGDFEIPTYCPILGMQMKQNRDHGKDDSFSIDEIIPGVGYVKGNVQVVSNKANIMKSNASRDQLLAFADWVYRTYRG
jgi:hypothetical protein